MITITRKAQFSAAHYYYLPELSTEENEKLFLKCSNRNGHGHNYVVEVTVSGKTNHDTGMLVNLKDLKALLNQEVIELLDHKHLNHEIPYFAEKLPTVENIAVFLYHRLEPPLCRFSLDLHRVRVQENDDLWADYYGGEDRWL